MIEWKKYDLPDGIGNNFSIELIPQQRESDESKTKEKKISGHSQ